MGAALDEARAALATDDVPIGAVVLAPSGDVLAAGRNVREAEHDPTGHAEVVAIRAAAAALGSWRLTGCTLVVTLEPCAHAGRKPGLRCTRVDVDLDFRTERTGNPIRLSHAELRQPPRPRRSDSAISGAENRQRSCRTGQPSSSTKRTRRVTPQARS